MDLKITHYPIGDLISAEYNPRQLTKDQFSQLKDSVKRFGLVDPLIVNTHKERKNIVIGGHQRLKVAKSLNIKNIPCIEVELSFEKERELNIRLNKNLGEWDYDNLANFFDMDELKDWGFNDRTLVGFENIVSGNKKGGEGDVKNTIPIYFKSEDYDEATNLINGMGDIYIGGLFLESLRVGAE